VLKLGAVTTGRRLHYSYEDYLSALEMSEVKLEYCDGEMYAMAGGTPAHAFLAAAAIALLRNELSGVVAFRHRISKCTSKQRVSPPFQT